MAWRLADSLVQLRNEVNAQYPNRSKTSDGTIGDSAHSSRVSQHNPNPAGVVTAIDLTHDPKNGPDGQQLADKLIQDPRAWYVIFNGRIRYHGGNWQKYSGSNPHRTHVHLSVKQDKANYDNKSTWNITGKKEEKEMASERAIDILSRVHLGRALDITQKQELMKKTFDEAEKWFKSLPEYKEKVALADSGELNAKDFLLAEYRNRVMDKRFIGSYLSNAEYEEIPYRVYKKKG